MRYVIARIEDYSREMAYRFYIAESLYVAGENKHLTKSFREIINEIGKPKDTRSANEMIDDALSALGITVIEE